MPIGKNGKQIKASGKTNIDVLLSEIKKETNAIADTLPHSLPEITLQYSNAYVQPKKIRKYIKCMLCSFDTKRKF